MSLAPLCHREIVCIPAHVPVRKAAEMMRKQHVGALAVTDSQDSARVVGLVTDRDIVVDVLAVGHSPDEKTVASVCRSQLVGVAASSSLQEAISHMEQYGVRRLFVARDDGSLLGLISMDDLIEAIADELGDLARTLRINIDKEDERTHPADTKSVVQPSLYLVRNEP
jgi:CBS domain-containing protein